MVVDPSTLTAMDKCVLEFFGTMIMILLGDGVCALCNLKKSKGQGAGWVVIAFGWGLAVMAGCFIASNSGAHLNPSVTIAMLVAGTMDAGLAAGYIVAQFLGAFLGAVLVWVAYKKHFDITEDKDALLGTFCTAPAIEGNKAWDFITEVIATFVLLILIFATGSNFGADVANIGAVNKWPITMIIVSIGMSLGGPTGYALNAARDLGPRMAHQVLPIPHKGSSQWGYSWVPLFGPIVGAVLATLVAQALGWA